MVKRLGTCDVLQAHCTVHIDDQDAHDRVLYPRTGDTIGDHSKLELLAYIEWTFLVVNVLVICAAIKGRSCIALFFEDTIATTFIALTICHGNSFEHIGGRNIGENTSDCHDYEARNGTESHERVWVARIAQKS